MIFYFFIKMNQMTLFRLKFTKGRHTFILSHSNAGMIETDNYCTLMEINFYDVILKPDLLNVLLNIVKPSHT